MRPSFLAEENEQRLRQVLWYLGVLPTPVGRPLVSRAEALAQVGELAGAPKAIVAAVRLPSNQAHTMKWVQVKAGQAAMEHVWRFAKEQTIALLVRRGRLQPGRTLYLRKGGVEHFAYVESVKAAGVVLVIDQELASNGKYNPVFLFRKDLEELLG